ncbi:DNA topoisomerase 2 [Massospora cicadina]|nr:DNA topoisomerase 2 [Massospora cicadina]
MSDHKAYFTSVDSDIVRPQPKKQKAPIPRNDSVTTNKGSPSLAPIFNATPHKVGKKKTVEIKELDQFSMADNIHKIPSMVDGLKPSQRKVVYGCFLQPDAEVNVLTLACRISTKLVYYHGPQSLTSAIIGLAQNFVGANNVNLLAPLGLFGSRRYSGKDTGATSYQHLPRAYHSAAVPQRMIWHFSTTLMMMA